MIIQHPQISPTILITTCFLFCASGGERRGGGGRYSIIILTSSFFDPTEKQFLYSLCLFTIQYRLWVCFLLAIVNSNSNLITTSNIGRKKRRVLVASEILVCAASCS